MYILILWNVSLNRLKWKKGNFIKLLVIIRR
jgi:hypothetical protein